MGAVEGVAVILAVEGLVCECKVYGVIPYIG